MFGDYDKTLWLILAGDVTGRERIASFVRDIPSECFEQVRQMIENYKSTGELQMSRVVKIMEDEVTRLSFDACVYEDGELSLTINKSFADGIFSDISFFSMKLCPFDTIYNRSDIIPVGKRDVGEISYSNSSRIVDCIKDDDDLAYYVGKEEKISMFFSPVGFFVEVNTEIFNQQDDKPESKKTKKRGSIRKIPDKLAPFDFRDLNGVNGLIKRKRPRRNKKF